MPDNPPGRWPMLVLAVALPMVVGAASGWWALDAPISHTRNSDWDFQLTMIEAVGRNLEVGRLPLWNPWTAGGVPLWANPEAPVGHPTAWLATWLHPATAVRVGLLLHVGVLGAAVVALARRAQPGAHLPGAHLPAMVALVGLLTVDALWWRVGHGHAMMVLAAWIPVAVAALASTRSPARRGVVAGLAIALMAWGGAPYPAWLGAVAITAWTALRVLQSLRLLGAACACLAAWVLLAGLPGALWLGLAAGAVAGWLGRSQTQPVRVRRDLVAFAWAAVTGALLSAPRWLVTAMSLHGVQRLDQPASHLASADHTGLQALSSVFLAADPQLVDKGLATIAPALHRLAGMHEGLPGWSTPLFGLLAVVGAWTLRRRLPELGALALVHLALSFGHNLPAPLFSWLHALPPLDRFGHPERHALVWVPLVAVLAGVGAGALWRGRLARVALVGLVVGHLAIAGPLAFGRADIDQVTADAYQRQGGDQPPFWHARGGPAPSGSGLGDDSTNLELASRGFGCLDCGDALQHAAPAGLAAGPWPGSGALVSWAPGKIVANSDSAVVLGESWRPGWTSDAGYLVNKEGPLTLSASGPTTLTYRPRGLGWGATLFGIGLLLAGGGLLGSRRQEPPPDANRRARSSPSSSN